MSVLTRKHPVSDVTGLRGQAVYAAHHVGPLAQQVAHQAKPLARTAGNSIRHGADEAVAWATPKVDAARHWAAPQLEQSAHAISESVAPMISSALISAAHKIDVKPKKSKGRRQAILAGAMVLTAAGGAAAVIATRRLHSANGYQASGDASGPGVGDQPDAERRYDADGGPPDSDMNGHPRIV